MTKVTETQEKIAEALDKVDELKNKVTQNPYFQQGVDMLSSLSGITDKESCIAFVKNYKPFIGNLEQAMKEIKKRGIKLKQKRKMGLITISAWFKGGMETRNSWLNSTTTIENTIWKSINFNSKTDDEKATTLSHEINHHIIWKEIGRVKYDASYLTNDWFKLAVELACYKVQYEKYTKGLGSGLTMGQIATKMVSETYSVKIPRDVIHSIMVDSY